MTNTWKFPSRSSDTEHTVTLNDGKLRCTCRGFKTPSKCWHVRDVAEKVGIDMWATSTTPSLFSEDTPSAANGFIEPMLASALKAGQTIHNFALDGWVLEEKYDGHRMIVHVTADRHIAWSRGGKQRMLPDHLRAQLDCVPPGVYDGELYIPGHTSTDVTRLDKARELHLVLFDILRISEQSCMHLTSHERRLLLEEALTLVEDRTVLYTAPQHPVTDDGLQEIWNRGGEGAIIKNVMTQYRPGKRSREWVKFKKAQSAVTIITGFESGQYGPHSVITAVDEYGIAVQVKSRNDLWREAFAADHRSFIGRELVISYQEKTRDGKYRHPMADHFLDAPELSSDE